MHAAGRAAEIAADGVRTILAQQVANTIEADPEDLVFADGRIEVAGSPGSGLSLPEAIMGAFYTSGPVTAMGRFQAPAATPEPGCVQGLILQAFNEPTYHCDAAEIAVDPQTGAIKVLRFLAVHDIGPEVNPAGVRGQIEGGVLQGIGYALWEEIQTNAEGVTVNASFVDYRVPTFADIPDEMEIIVVSDHPGADGPMGAKGIGEAPVILPAAAIGSAVRDALGDQPTQLPLSADRVRRLAAAGQVTA
jgi:CO/xanthine dehydrogenase Mo-binding subunit